jgi:hypothetical protein
LNSFLLHLLLAPQALKKEIAQLKQGSGGGALAVSSTSASSLVDGSKEEIAIKLIAYQQFMAKYIVDSHQQKVLAVKAAEAAVVKRYEEKIQFLLGGTAPVTASVLAPPPATAENTSYAARSAKVTAAAKAGKSRWGDLENSKAAGTPVTAPPVVKAVTASSTSAAPVKQTITNIGASIVNGVIPEVEAADHGLRADGGVGGFTLAERVTLGADVLKVNGATANGASAPMAMASSTVAPAYLLRNAKIAAAAKAGKSRWGPLEIQRAQSMASLPLSSRAASAPVPPEVLAADHGLRADGGVGGPTLAERVNLGARLLGN